MKTKNLKLATLLIAAIVFVSCIAGICLSVFPVTAATYNADSVFTAESSNAITAQAGQNVKFSFTGEEDNTVSYNRNLAYKWFTKSETDVQPVANYFSMEFSFADSVEFDTFTVTFQSVEKSKSDDGVTENQIIFINEKDGKHYVAFRTNGDKDVEVAELAKQELVSLDSYDIIRIEFSEGENAGDYNVVLSVGNTVQQKIEGKFTNIHGDYVKYSASKIVPLAFSAEVPEGKTQGFTMRSLNGQGFELNGDGKIVDNVAPVLVINDEIKSFTLGMKLLNFSYEVIDVCDSTVSKTMTYYQYDPEGKDTEYKALTGDKKILDKYFKNEGKEYVSIKFELNDDDDNKETYFVSWYAENRTENVTEYKVGEENIEFLTVTRDEEAPVYTCIKTEEGSQTLEETEAYIRYQQAVREAAQDLRAGEGYSFYLPSLEDLIEDNDSAYSSLSFTIYYRTDANNSNSVSSNLSYDNLKITVNSTGGYQFKVVAADKQGNTMQFYRDGNIVTLDTDNVWKIDAIPAFEFFVENKGLEVAETETLDNAYMYSNYSVEKFTIKGLSGYKSEYKLFYMDGVSIADISYNTLVKFVNDCYKNGVSEEDFMARLADTTGVDLSSAGMRNIKAYDSNGPKDEDDAGWSTSDNRYNWKESSLSFTPQERGYYVVSVKLVDKENWSEPVYAYKVVYANSEVDQNKGETYWIENNIVTVVFAAIAGVAAIVLIVVWIAFPSTEEVKGAKSDKKSSSGKFSDRRKKDDK